MLRRSVVAAMLLVQGLRLLPSVALTRTARQGHARQRQDHEELLHVAAFLAPARRNANSKKGPSPHFTN